MHFSKPDQYSDHVRTDLVEMLPVTCGRFLDVGCGTGGTLELIKSRGAAYTAGVDIDAESIKKAKNRLLDSVIVADIEKDDLPYTEKEFDCIILADVLEHLYDPWKVLKEITKYLADTGYILLSFPNVKYYKVLRRLIFHDEWTYVDAGILDITHIRFFTLKEIDRLLAVAGLKTVQMKKHIVSSQRMRLLNKLLINKLDSFLAYQYHILAKK